ncbi:MAG: protein-glutamate O-methyltransferase CheR [Ardenticatenaceae bacterium]|nr:protein-glutamate O-methyltransferase CheR [Ardenticatenaceae bacterium]MCB9442785.1 protein-glutamate O-methyltransferase CheR [Ardenticatenaceae bacterium]
MHEVDIEEIAVDLLLEAIYRRFGYDFRNYARASLQRRIHHFQEVYDIKSVADIIPRILVDEALFLALAGHFSVMVTEMFRDPGFFLAIRQKVLPALKTFAAPRIWHAGCATGEEVYSAAILLQEETLYSRVTIFATDFNDEALAAAKDGIYALDNIQQYTRNYQLAGGKQSFSDYYHADYGRAVIKSSLKKNITFANHNLVADHVFSEMHLIFCRNVLIYFNQDLQNRALALFRDSLAHGGFLCLGSNESLLFSEVEKDFTVVDEKQKIYKKKRL